MEPKSHPGLPDFFGHDDIKCSVNNDESKPRDKSANSRIHGWFIGIVVVLCCGLAAYLYMNPWSSTNEEVETKEEDSKISDPPSYSSTGFSTGEKERYEVDVYCPAFFQLEKDIMAVERALNLNSLSFEFEKATVSDLLAVVEVRCDIHTGQLTKFGAKIGLRDIKLAYQVPTEGLDVKAKDWNSLENVDELLSDLDWIRSTTNEDRPRVRLQFPVSWSNTLTTSAAAISAGMAAHSWYKKLANKPSGDAVYTPDEDVQIDIPEGYVPKERFETNSRQVDSDAGDRSTTLVALGFLFFVFLVVVVGRIIRRRRNKSDREALEHCPAEINIDFKTLN